MSIRILVYDNDHPPPHCHVRRSDGTETRVAIPSLRVLTGPALSKNEKETLLDQIDDLCDRFDKLNPATHKKGNHDN